MVSVHAFRLYSQRRSTCLLWLSSLMMRCSCPHTCSLSGLQLALRSARLMKLKSYSTGFSHGEYCALSSTFTLNLRAVS